MLTGPEARERREDIGTSTTAVAVLAHVDHGNLSRWERGCHGVFSAASVERIEQALADVLKVKKAHKGVALDMNDIVFLRKAIRELGRNKKPRAVPQTHGSAFIKTFCTHSHLDPEEFRQIALLRPAVLRASCVSLPCQRWIACWSSALARALGNDFLFSVYAKKFPTRDAALQSLAMAAYSLIIKEIGENRLEYYREALNVTNEVTTGSSDPHEN
jgi:hypothetical protein